MLLPSQIQVETYEDRHIFFGNGDFPGEAEFLEAIGEALAAIGPTFARWNEICVASGLHHECKGLFIRYLPSDPANQLADVSEQEIKRRIERWAPVRARRTDSVSAQQPKQTKTPAKEIKFARTSSPGAAPPATPRPYADDAPVHKQLSSPSFVVNPDREAAFALLGAMATRNFTAALDQYRTAPNGDTVSDLLNTVQAFTELGSSLQHDEVLISQPEPERNIIVEG